MPYKLLQEAAKPLNERIGRIGMSRCGKCLTTIDQNNGACDCPDQPHAVKGRHIVPSATDYQAYLKTDPTNHQNLEQARCLSAGYKVWRRAWIACEFQHGLRTADTPPDPEYREVPMPKQDDK